jgi:uncharacterized protein (DUF58 family)
LRTLIPERRLLAALLAALALYAITPLSPAVWLVLLIYMMALAWLAGRDARRLPRAGDLVVSRAMRRPLSLGATEEVVLRLAAAGAAGLRALVADHVPAELLPDRRELAGTFAEDGRLELRYRLRPPRRGAYRFGPVDVRLRRRGGWWMRQVSVPAAEDVAVFPDVIQVRAYQASLRRGLRRWEGQRRDRRPGATTAFAALRDYVPGDDARRIDWRATARRDRPITAEVEAERGQQVIIAIDCGRLMTGRAGLLTKLDHSVNAALLLAWAAQGHGDRVGMLTFADRVLGYLPPRPGGAQVGRVNLALYGLAGRSVEPDFRAAMGFLGRRVSRRSLVVLLTDVIDREASADLVASCLQLRRRHAVLVVAMADPALAAAFAEPVADAGHAYRWAAAVEMSNGRRASFEVLRRGGVLGLDVAPGELSPRLVERYLELKERAVV